MTHKE